MAEQKQDDQFEHTYNSYVRIRNVALKTSGDERLGEVATEGQGYPYWRHDMKMMMMIVNIVFSFINISTLQKRGCPRGVKRWTAES